jgi:hypothetical protein
MSRTQTKPTTTAADVVNDLHEVTSIYGDDVLQSIIDNLDDDAPEDLYFAHGMLQDLYGAVKLAFVHLDQLIDRLEAEGGIDRGETGGKTA